MPSIQGWPGGQITQWFPGVAPLVPTAPSADDTFPSHLRNTTKDSSSLLLDISKWGHVVAVQFETSTAPEQLVILWPEVDCLQLGCTRNIRRRTHIVDISVMLQTTDDPCRGSTGGRAAAWFTVSPCYWMQRQTVSANNCCKFFNSNRKEQARELDIQICHPNRKQHFIPIFIPLCFAGRQKLFCRFEKKLTLWLLGPTGRVETDSKAEMLQGATMWNLPSCKLKTNNALLQSV